MRACTGLLKFKGVRPPVPIEEVVAASEIVKSRFFTASSVRPDDRDEMDAKYDELYVHLVEEMHAALADLGSSPEETEKRRTESEAAAEDAKRASLLHLKRLADEYEINDAHVDAEKWHQERVLLTEKCDAAVWCAYGALISFKPSLNSLYCTSVRESTAPPRFCHKAQKSMMTPSS